MELSSGIDDMRQSIAFNLTASGGVSSTITTSQRKQGIANIFPYKKENQHYTAFLHINDEKTDRIHTQPTDERNMPDGDIPLPQGRVG